MITDERFTAYINSLENGNPAYLDELEAYAKQTQVPIIRKEMQSFMRTLLIMNKPKRILEVGTAIGFSALFMSEFMPEGGHITTIEKYEKRIPLAEKPSPDIVDSLVLLRDNRSYIRKYNYKIH